MCVWSKVKIVISSSVHKGDVSGEKENPVRDILLGYSEEAECRESI